MLHTVAKPRAPTGLLYPLVYDTIVDQVFAARGGAAIAMLTQFMTQWSAETRKWVDATLKAIVTESAENRSIVQDWVDAWLPGRRRPCCRWRRSPCPSKRRRCSMR